MAKKFLFSLNSKDFEIQTFCAGGKGGQHQNRTRSGVRIIHLASGARGECRNFRSQPQNRKHAFTRLAASKEFKAWHKLEVARRLATPDIAAWVDAQMDPKNLRVEIL